MDLRVETHSFERGWLQVRLQTRHRPTVTGSFPTRASFAIR
jgi:hypothetical protein